MFERDVPDNFSVSNPRLYHAGQKGLFFNFMIFWKWIILSIIHGGTNYYVIVYVIFFHFIFKAHVTSYELKRPSR